MPPSHRRPARLDEPHWGTRNNAQAEANIARLTEAGRRVQARGDAGAAETVYTKDVNSAFIGTTLDADLRARGVTALVMAGLSTDHCVSEIHRAALASLHGEFATVADTDALIGPDLP